MTTNHRYVHTQHKCTGKRVVYYFNVCLCCLAFCLWPQFVGIPIQILIGLQVAPEIFSCVLYLAVAIIALYALNGIFVTEVVDMTPFEDIVGVAMVYFFGF